MLSRFVIPPSLWPPLLNVIGADWFQYYDEPKYGRNDGENYNMGLVDIYDQPYEEITLAAKILD